MKKYLVFSKLVYNNSKRKQTQSKTTNTLNTNSLNTFLKSISIQIYLVINLISL